MYQLQTGETIRVLGDFVQHFETFFEKTQGCGLNEKTPRYGEVRGADVIAEGMTATCQHTIHER